MNTDLGHPDSFRECCTFFLSSNGCSLKRAEAVKWSEVKWSEEMGVSKNNGTPKSSILIGFSIIFTIHFGAHPYLWKHPDQNLRSKRWLSVLNHLNGREHATTCNDHRLHKNPPQALDSRSEPMEPLQLSPQNCRSSIPATKETIIPVWISCVFFIMGSHYMHIINDHKRFCWNKCFVMGFSSSLVQSNSAQIFTTKSAEGKFISGDSTISRPLKLRFACAKNTAKAAQIKGRLRWSGWKNLSGKRPWGSEFLKIAWKKHLDISSLLE